MTVNTVAKSARGALPAMHQTSDELLHSAGKAVTAARACASDALDQAENQMRQLRGSVDPVVDRLTSKAQQLARHSLDLAAEAKYRAGQSLRHASRAATRYVADQPVRSVLIAAAVGAVAALLISSARRRNQNPC